MDLFNHIIICKIYLSIFQNSIWRHTLGQNNNVPLNEPSQAHLSRTLAVFLADVDKHWILNYWLKIWVKTIYFNLKKTIISLVKKSK